MKDEVERYELPMMMTMLMTMLMMMMMKDPS
jgi:hypothetical protein